MQKRSYSWWHSLLRVPKSAENTKVDEWRNEEAVVLKATESDTESI